MRNVIFTEEKESLCKWELFCINKTKDETGHFVGIYAIIYDNICIKIVTNNMWMILDLSLTMGNIYRIYHQHMAIQNGETDQTRNFGDAPCSDTDWVDPENLNATPSLHNFVL